MTAQILVGVLLGPAVLKLVVLSPGLASTIKLASCFIVFAAGLELDFFTLWQEFKLRGRAIALLSFLLPFVCGLALGAAFSLEFQTSTILALCISVTALPVMVRILKDFSLLDSRVARLCIAAAVVNDAAALLILGLLLNQNAPSSTGLHDQVNAYIMLGIFLAAVLLGPTARSSKHFRRFDAIVQGSALFLFAPLFFAFIGLQFTPAAFEQPLFMGCVLVVSAFSKIVAGWLGGRIAGLSNRESLSIGAMLNGRGVMELVVANVALRVGMIDGTLFSILVIMGLVTTLMTPLLFRRLS